MPFMPPRLRMLMLSPVAPWPATTGGLVRIAALLDQMARHFELTFIAPRHADQIAPADMPVEFLCPALPDTSAARRARAAADWSRSFHAALYRRAEVAHIVRRELSRGSYDVVYSHFIYGMEYLGETRVPVVVDQQNVDRRYWRNKADHSRFPINVFARWNARRTVAFENRVLPHIWAYVSVSEEDRQQTRLYADPPVEHFWVAPNGVDTQRFKPYTTCRDNSAVTLGYLGSMDLQMNVEAVQRFCRSLLPRIRERLRDIDVRFLVIGRNPSAAVEHLAADIPGMSVSGTVDDVLPWLHKVDIVVCPLRIGAGTKLKVAEAMSSGLPVVGSGLAFAGIPGHAGEDYVMADDDDAFVEAVCRLSRNSGERAVIGARARHLAQQHLDWTAIGQKLASELSGALAHESVPGTI
jgi:glycosyltransferase involved in cell wall biosynthesis